MCRPIMVPMNYKHSELINDLNEFMIAVKIWMHPELFGEAVHDLKTQHPQIDIKDIDALQRRINEVLKKDAESFVKY